MTEILIILIATVSAVLVLSRLGLGTVLGYLVAGAIIGPGALGLINDAESIRHIGEFGVVFLLFLIGIEIKPRRLWVMRRMVVGLGGAQVIVTAAVIYLCARYIIGWDARAALVAGGGLALSSTAFGLQTLAETNKLTSHWGRASFSVLLFQDLAVVPFLVLLPIIAHGAFDVSQSMGLAILESLAVLGAVLVVGRFALTPLFHLVARSGSKEVFAATALLLVLGSAWLLDQVGLSMAMGAFLAGILLSNNEYRHQVEADVEPFRGLLLGLFFISVGMAVDVSRLANDWALVLFGTIGLLVIKTSLIYGLGRMSGLK
ncbi:MAG TPA: monovalent cation:proton antiporter-2 (CPA2) family protein, partial [Paracoccaceae bacterium]|nr:monovalent cation:proton antiporter-2 (CPA2) family protein [Paracoccaceae bacterium]